MRKIDELIQTNVRELYSPYPGTIRMEAVRSLKVTTEKTYRTDRGTITDISELSTELARETTVTIHDELYGEILDKLFIIRSMALLYPILYANVPGGMAEEVEELIRTINGYGNIRPVPILERI